MTIESFFVKKFEKLETEKNELEKENKGLQIDLMLKNKQIETLIELIEEGLPKITSGGYLSLSVFIDENRAKKYRDLFKKLNVDLEGEQK